MPTDHRDQVEELLADYRRSREQLASVQRDLLSITESASTPDGLVTAKVGPQGTLTGLVIADAAYQRYRPHELAAAVLRVTGEAAAKVAERTHRALAPVLPASADPAALVTGQADLRPAELAGPQAPAPRAAEPQQPMSPPPVRHRAVAEDDEDSYEQHSWLRDTGRGRQT